MESQWLPLYADLGYNEGILRTIASSYYNLALNEDDIIGIICYLLPGGFDEPGQKGFRNLGAEQQNVYMEIGEEIIR
jgi:hypothetical protein